MLQSSRLFLQRISSSVCSSFYLLSCGPVSVGSSLRFLASFLLQALSAVFAVVFPSGLFLFLPYFLARLASGARPPPLSLCLFLGEVCCFPPVALLPCTVLALPLFLFVLLFFPLVLVVFSFLLVLFLLLPSFLCAAFFADYSSCSSGSSLSLVSSSSSSSLAFSFHPRSSVWGLLLAAVDRV